MKKNIRKTLGFLAVCCLLIGVLCPIASSAEEYVKWELSDDQKTLTDGQKEYVRYTLPLGVYAEPDYEYLYKQKVLDGYTVFSTEKGGDLVWFGDYPDYCVYVTIEAKGALDAFVHQDRSGVFRLTGDHGYMESALDAELIQKLNALGEETVTMDVTELEDLFLYDLRLYESNNVFYKTYGAIYKIEGKLYYLCYRDLPNNHFDANGDFSYRSGTVTLTKTDEETAQALSEAVDRLEHRAYDRDYEGGNRDGEDDYEEGFSFRVAFVFWGFVLPILFIGMGLLLPRFFKTRFGAHWRYLAYGSTAWFVLALILLLMIK